MNVTKSKTGSYACNHEEHNMYVIAKQTKDKLGSSITISCPAYLKTISYEGASPLGAVEQMMRDNFNKVPLIDALRALHEKIMDDLGLEYDERFY